MTKIIKSIVKLQIPAGLANPSPPVGPALGQHGVNIIDFCKSFNIKTESFEKGLPIPLIITIYTDRSFQFIIKTVSAAILLKKTVGIVTGANKPDKKKPINKISITKIIEIAKIKAVDMTGANIEAISRSIIGTAHSMGIVVET